MLSKKILIIPALFMAQSALADQNQPLSAIDWLSDTVTAPIVMQPVSKPQKYMQTDVASSASVEDVTVTPLDGPTPDAVGLLPVSVTGLPRDFWGTSQSADLSRIISKAPVRALPALQELLHMILLAELDAPVDGAGGADLFLARIDKLLDIGQLQQAQAMLERAGTNTAPIFRRWFDVTLLTGTENSACEVLKNNASFSPTFPARIFCLARTGDWNAAAVTLETANALGKLEAGQYDLISRFLDPELFEGEADLPRPEHISPLTFIMFEAIGQPLNTSILPRAFAVADLRPTTGWKAQIEAAERLVLSGAIDENQLLGIYTKQKPAASGGVWERLFAVQALDKAISADDATAVAKYLPIVVKHLKKAQLLAPIADFFGVKLAQIQLDADSATMAFHLGLLSEDYEKIATGYSAVTSRDKFLVALAHGDLSIVQPFDATTRAISAAFQSKQTAPEYSQLIKDKKLGEAVLLAISRFPSSSNGNLENARKSLILLRSVGLEDIARRSALQLILLDQQG